MVPDLYYSGTGHRPEKLGGYEPKAEEHRISYAINILPSYHPTKMILGFALGWDTALAHACVRLGIPFLAAIPFKGQELLWPKEAQAIYHDLLSKADEVVIVCEGGYAPWKLQKRNEYMVDNSNGVIALWDGSSGGTCNCVKYAEKKNVPVYNVWPGWESYVGCSSEQIGLGNDLRGLSS